MVKVRWWYVGVLLQVVACGSSSRKAPSESTAGSGGQPSGGAASGAAGTTSGGRGGADGGTGGGASAGSGGAGMSAPEAWSEAAVLPGTGSLVFQLLDATAAVEGGAWVGFGGSTLSIARFTAEGGWSAPAFTTTEQAQVRPRLASSAQTSLAVWVEPGEALVMSSALHDGSAWAASGTFGDGGDSVEDLELAMSSAGAAVAVWITLVYGDDLASHQYTVMGAVFDGSAWSPAATIASRAGGFLAWPRVAIDEQGRALALWRDSDAAAIRSTDIAASRFDGSTWSAPEIVSPGNGTDGWGHDVALHGDGKGLVVWRRESSLAGRAFDPSDGFGAEQELEPGNGGFSKLNALPNGSMLVTWGDEDEALIGRNWRADGTLDEPVTIAPSGRQIFGWHDLTVDAAGNVAAAWPRASGAVTIEAALQRTGSAWSAPTSLDVAAPTSNDWTYPAVVSSNGRAIVAWVHTDADGTRSVQASASPGPP